ncbi:hypothetical protein [Arenibaculum pallidiluteum]|uniref:hypothetical protein n=1 Tax=Arenibaculum pallidiluteum TaxID=2812559 RepID=UPI001A95B08F|nr:hypothetical protein [Arenibaculum pallidiluteum]
MSEFPDHGREALFVDVLLELVGRRPLVVLMDPDASRRAALLDRLVGHLRAGDALVETDPVPAEPERLLAELAPRLAAAPLGVLVVDAAESRDPDLIRRLVLMAGGQPCHGPALQVLLAGGPRLAELLQTPPLREQVERIGAVRRACDHVPAAAPSRPRDPVPMVPNAAKGTVKAAARTAAIIPLGPRRRVVLAALGFVAFAAGLTANTAARHLAPPEVPEQRLEIVRAALPAPLPKPPASEPVVAEAEADIPVPVPRPAAAPEPRRNASRHADKGNAVKPGTRTQRARPQSYAEDGCRRGIGGQTVREASVQAVLEGFVSDIRSLGHCLIPSASAR